MEWPWLPEMASTKMGRDLIGFGKKYFLAGTSVPALSMVDCQDCNSYIMYRVYLPTVFVLWVDLFLAVVAYCIWWSHACFCGIHCDYCLLRDK